MTHRKSILALAVVAAVGLSGCGGSSGGGGDDTDNGDGNGGNGGPDSQNYQTDFRNTDRYNVTVDNGLTISDQTLAITTSAEASSDFDGPFTAPNGKEITPKAYHGAVDPDAPEADDDHTNEGPFWDGWVYRNDSLTTNLPSTSGADEYHPLEDNIGAEITSASSDGSEDCPAGDEASNTTDVFGTPFPVCVINDGDLDKDVELTNDHVYVLAETVQVGNGDREEASNPDNVDSYTLTIEEGTQIFGDDDAASSLVITRGSEIDAVGTAELPIIFGGVTYDEDNEEIEGKVTDLTGRGDWGSLVLSGYGEVNAANEDNQIQTEAVPDGVTRWYGGTDNDDSSGTVKYAVVAETGFAFRQDEEVQGITIEGSGSGTTTSHIQILNSDDDGIEWFGGSANADHMVIQAATDDSLDQDLGFQGTVDTALIVQGPDHGNRGMETDNNGDDFGATPKSKPVMTNITVLGHRGNESDLTAGALHREGYGGQVYRSVYADNNSNVAGGDITDPAPEFQEGCLDIDSEVDEDLVYGDVVFNCDAGSLSDDNDKEEE